MAPSTQTVEFRRVYLGHDTQVPITRIAFGTDVLQFFVFAEGRNIV